MYMLMPHKYIKYIIYEIFFFMKTTSIKNKLLNTALHKNLDENKILSSCGNLHTHCRSRNFPTFKRLAYEIARTHLNVSQLYDA